MDKVSLNVRGEVEVQQNDRPCRKVPLVEDRKPIKGECEGNIALVLKVPVIKCLAVSLSNNGLYSTYL